MRRVSVDDRSPDDVGALRRSLTDALAAEHLAINHYRVPPGEGLPGGLHAHADQAELFYVLDGRLTFETYSHDEGGAEFTLAADQVVRFRPGEFQSGHNAADVEAVVLALGAPRDTGDVRVPFACEACGHRDLRLALEDTPALACPACGEEWPLADCQDCGGEDLRAWLDDGEPVVVCGDCAATFERPPTV